MSEALFILNPREIPACIASIEALDVPKCWLSYMTEVHAAEHINAMIRHSPYDRYLLLSDDTIVSQGALDKVLELHGEGAAVATGYSNLDQLLPSVNLSTNTLPAPPPRESSYELRTQAEVDAIDGPFRTTFAGFSLTCMSRDMWLKYPVEPTILGGQMDYQLSYRLGCDQVPIITHRDARIEHVKENVLYPDQAPEKRSLVHARPPSIRWSA